MAVALVYGGNPKKIVAMALLSRSVETRSGSLC